MLLFTQELNTALITAVVALITTIVGFFIAIFKNENLRLAIINRLIGGVRGRGIINLDDLNHHDIVVKIRKILATGEHDSLALVASIERRILFKSYMEIICNVYLESVEYILKQDFVNFNEGDLKILIIEQMGRRRKLISKRIQEYLLAINSDRNKASLIADKLEEWRVYECKMINNNILTTISSGRFLSVAYKLDIILYQYAMGLDIIISNGADSFEKLNGELDSFLGNKTDK